MRTGGEAGQDMDPEFWLDRWQRQDIGFHQKSTHDLLARHWPLLAVPRGAPVFVPLSGKSLDMVWLAEHGYSVIGSELSELAVRAFFEERARAPGIEGCGSATVFRAGPYELWCGDYFAMPAEATRRIGAVFDRAALVAMPRVHQAAYAAKLAELTPSGVPVLLITLDYDPSEMSGPPFPIPHDQVLTLFKDRFHVARLEVRDGLSQSANLKARGLTALEDAAYCLRRL